MKKEFFLILFLLLVESNKIDCMEDKPNQKRLSDSMFLNSIYNKQFYISKILGSKNNDFENELGKNFNDLNINEEKGKQIFTEYIPKEDSVFQHLTFSNSNDNDPDFRIQLKDDCSQHFVVVIYQTSKEEEETSCSQKITMRQTSIPYDLYLILGPNYRQNETNVGKQYSENLFRWKKLEKPPVIYIKGKLPSKDLNEITEKLLEKSGNANEEEMKKVDINLKENWQKKKEEVEKFLIQTKELFSNKLFAIVNNNNCLVSRFNIQESEK